MLLVDEGDGPRHVRLVDFLRDNADNTDRFERVGALAVGEAIEFYRGRSRPPLMVTRIS